MEKELNIAAILKDKPSKTKLWSPIVGDCTFNDISSKNGAIVASFIDKDGEQRDWDFNKFGKTLSAPKEASVCLFPSKLMQNWSKFAWKKGDILLCEENKLCIFDKWANEDYTEIEVKYTMPDYGNAKFKTSSCYKETNEFVIKKYVSLIELTKGGKLNLSTLQIEKPKQKFKFEPFDKVLVRDNDEDCVWNAAFFSHKDGKYFATTDTHGWQQCIPYNDHTKHLLGTTDEWKGGEG